MNNKAFTLIEMVMVVVLVAILASLALPRYVKVVEKGRSTEARDFLGHIRSLETAYYLEYDTYTTNLSALSVGAPSACNASFYFNYSITGGGAGFAASANRCTASGRAPNAQTTYVLNMTQAGVLDGTAAYL